MLNFLTFPLLAAAVGYLLGIAAKQWYVAKNPLEQTIADLLPNGQCGQCGYPGCNEAAKAMVAYQLSATGCPLADAVVISKIADTLGIPLENKESDEAIGMVAGIDVDKCDGCSRCLKKCPFDAIVGAPKQLHGIIASACTGCQQCIAVCPHQGITLYPDPQLLNPIHKPMWQSLQLDRQHV
ncbi:RnfABCDGE type electron transport complex subunit B [Celerinatantimonas yamalensis]|uniref:RnfABCDGE type electron transport complex subunit B n=1 Tax=Celerinatantimonas yamalensis TaxID=559956 RepID=A0ABW9G3N9_9GAMM